MGVFDMNKPKISTIIGLCFLALYLSGCGSTQTVSDNTEEKNKIQTFETDKQSIISLFEETGQYVETNLYEFEDDEKNICGTIRLNPEDYENPYADECIYTQLRTYKDKTFAVYLTYDVSGDEMYYQKLPELVKKVLFTIKPNANVDETVLIDFDIKIDDIYCKDFEDLRYSISYKEWGETETRIEIIIVHLDDNSIQ